MRVSAKCGSTVLEVVKSSLLKHRIKLTDFYLWIEGSRKDCAMTIIDKSMNECNIHVCPRIRAGGRSMLTIEFEQLSTLINKRSAALFSTVTVSPDLTSSKNEEVAVFLSPLSQYLLMRILAFVCLDGHVVRKCSWYGKFDLSNIYMSADGHIVITAPELKYTADRGKNDYTRLLDIISNFADLGTGKYPLYVRHLLWLLQNATEKQRLNKQSVYMLVGHLSLLNYAERAKVIELLDKLIISLSPAEHQKMNRALQDPEWWYYQNGFDWWVVVQKLLDFKRIYWFKAIRFEGVRYSCYGEDLKNCFHFGRNFLTHVPRRISQFLADAALSLLMDFILAEVIEALSCSVSSGGSGEVFIDVVSNPKADASIRRYWFDPEEDAH